MIYGIAENKEKAFFFEKKKQKTFIPSGRTVRDSYPKVFCFGAVGHGAA
jgi:hypothetical protein